MIRLKLQAADGRILEFADEPITLGRASGNHLVLEDRRVSRCHARIERSGSKVFLADLQSGNGTRLNGTRIERERLVAGDAVRVGPAEFVVLQLSAADDTPPPRPVVFSPSEESTVVQPPRRRLSLSRR